MEKVKTTIAVIRNETIIDKVIFAEESAEKALEMAGQFLEAGHFGGVSATDVKILEEGFTIGDYFIDGAFVKAVFYAVLDENNMVTGIDKRPESMDMEAVLGELGEAAEAIRISDNAPGLIGMVYADGEFSEPPREPTNAEIFKLIKELKEEIRQIKRQK